MIKWLIIIPLVLAALIAGLSLYLQPNDFTGCEEVPALSGEKCRKADVIVVVSGGDTRARTEAGIKLFKNGWADAIVFSGAAQDTTGPSNAAVMKQQALDSGVPAASTYIDEFAQTTQQNAVNTQSIFDRHHFKDVILVTSGYHQRRASLEFEKRAGDITVLNHPVPFDRDWSFLWWLTPRGWWLAGGEAVKITIFHLQGAR